MASFDALRGADQRFADALTGPDGTGDPAVLMPVLEVYPDALSAPMPDVALPVVPPAVSLPAAALAAGRQPPGQAAPAAATAPARRRTTDTRSLPPQYAQRPTTPRPPPQTRGGSPRPVPPSTPAPTRPGWTGQVASRADLANLVKGVMAGQPPTDWSRHLPGTMPQRPAQPAVPRVQRPAAPLPTPNRSVRSQGGPGPTRPRRKGSSAWVVIVFLVVVAFASGLAQQFINLISELFNR